MVCAVPAGQAGATAVDACGPPANQRRLAALCIMVVMLALPAAAAADPWAPAERPAGTALVSDASLMVDPGQALTAVWRDAEGVRVARRAAPAPWGTASDPLPGSSRSAAFVVATRTAAGDLVVAWQESGATPTLRIARRPAGATGFDQLVAEGVAVTAGPMAIASDGLGGVHVAFVDGDGRVAVADVSLNGDVQVDQDAQTPLGPDAPTERDRTVTDLAAAPDRQAIAVCWSGARDSGGSAGSCTLRQDGNWEPDPLLSTTTAGTAAPRAAFGPGGAVLAATQQVSGLSADIVYAYRDAADTSTTGSGSVPAAPVPVATPLDVAIDGSGRRTLVWQSPADTDGGGSVRAFTPGSSAEPKTVQDGLTPGHIALVRSQPLADGGVGLLYTTGDAVAAARREAEAPDGEEPTFGAPSTLASLPDGAAVQALGISAAPEPDGEAAAWWSLSTPPAPPAPPPPGSFTARVLDRTGPAVVPTVPATARVGQPVRFVVEPPADAWSPAAGPPSWDFGDGSTATGERVVHTYAAPGRYTVALTAADAAGNATTSEQEIAVDEAPAPPPRRQEPAPSQEPQPPQEPAPQPDSPTEGSQTSEPPPPVAHRSGNAEPVAGTISVRRPGDDEFRPLPGLQRIPVGTLVDAREGTVRLTVAADTGGGVQRGRFDGGVFEFTQHRLGGGAVRRGRGTLAAATRRRSDLLVTDLTLTGSGFGLCPVLPRPDATAESAGRRRVRYLRARAHGRFRVAGRSASGIERGTAWTTTDTCTATVVQVADGAVLVRDLVRMRKVIVRAGGSYRAPHAAGVRGVDPHTPNRASLLRHGLRFRQRLPGPGVARWQLDLSVWDKPVARVARRIPPPVAIGTARARVRSAGSVEVRVRLTPEGRRLLLRHPRAKLVLRTRFRGRGGVLRSDVLVPM